MLKLMKLEILKKKKICISDLNNFSKTWIGVSIGIVVKIRANPRNAPDVALSYWMYILGGNQMRV